MVLLINLIAGILGVFLYTLIKARKGIHADGFFDSDRFVRENFWAWLFALLIIVVLAISVQLIPDVTNAIQLALPGFELQNSPIGFFGFGLFFSFGGKELSR